MSIVHQNPLSLLENALIVLYSPVTESSSRARADEFLRVFRLDFGRVVDTIRLTLSSASSQHSLEERAQFCSTEFAHPPSQEALLFLCSSLDERVSVDWHGLKARDQWVVTEVVFQLIGKTALTVVPAAASHACSAAATCVARSAVDLRDRAWDQVVIYANRSGMLYCLWEALASAFERETRFNPALDDEVNAFLRLKSKEIGSEAPKVLLQYGTPSWVKRSAVRCLMGWFRYLPAGVGVDSLASSIKDPLLSQDISDSLIEALRNPDIGSGVVSRLIAALTSVVNESYTDATKSENEKSILSHAVAEVAVGIVESVCDRFIRNLTPNREDTVLSIARLLVRCMDFHRPAFLSACTGVALLAATLVEFHAQDSGITDSLARSATRIIPHLLIPIEIEDDPEVDDILVQVRPVVRDMLLQIAILVGPASYSSLFSNFLGKSLLPSHLEVVFFAIIAASDAPQLSSSTHFLPFLNIATSPSLRSSGFERLIITAVQLVNSYSPLVLHSQEIFESTYSLLTTAFRLHPEVSSEALASICEENPDAVVTRLTEIVELYRSLPFLSVVSREAARALGRVISAVVFRMNATQQRMLVHTVVAESLGKLHTKTWRCSSELILELGLIAALVESVEDHNLSITILNDLLPILRGLVLSGLEDDQVSQVIARILDACLNWDLIEQNNGKFLHGEEPALLESIDLCRNAVVGHEVPEPTLLRTLILVAISGSRRGHHLPTLPLTLQIIGKRIEELLPPEVTSSSLSGISTLLCEWFDSFGILLEDSSLSLKNCVLDRENAQR
mmetsp:Transcript_9311/g.19007  ORF Transcript_9311/g.19007 Transcript_9311/m.19007 type:complete len:792 (+) Transcript_9311:7283-9658(+)